MLAAEQKRQGVDVCILLRRSGVNQQLVDSADLKVHRLVSTRPGISMLIEIERAIHSFRPDLIQTWLPQMDILGGIAAARNAIPWIISERTGETFYSKFNITLGFRLLISRYARAVIANSLGGLHYWEKSSSPRTSLFHIPNAVDVAAVQSAKLLDRAVSPNTAINTILVVGRLQDSKGVDTVIRAFAKLALNDRYRLLVIGDGPMREALHALVKDLSLTTSVCLLPYTHDWWKYFQEALLLVSMSKFEGQPNVVLEAMAAQCPVIVSDIQAHRELLSEDSAVFVPLGQTQALSDALAFALSDQLSAARRASAAYRVVEQRTIQSVSALYTSVYNQILSERHV